MSKFDLTWEDLGEEKALLHCNVYEWSHLVSRELDAAVGRLFNELEEAGYSEALTVSPNQKFCEYMGGTYVTDVDINSEEYGIYRWELK